MKKNGKLSQMIIQIVFIILNVTLVKSQTTIINPAQFSNLYSTSYSYIISNVIISIPGNQTSSQNETYNEPIIRRQNNSGLSTGAICAIAIPTIAALLGVAAAAALFSGAAYAPPLAKGFTAPALPEPNYIDTSLAKFQIPDQVPIQQPQPVQIIQQPQPVQIIEQPQLIQPEPIKEVPRVDYQLNRVIEPVPQQVQMVPVQEVEMVPVQEVEMVPVEQVEMVPVQQIEAIPGVNGVPIQQIPPMNQVVPIGQPAGVVAPQGQLGNQLISSSSQIITQSQGQGVQYLPSQYI
jgi:hypothetical protein